MMIQLLKIIMERILCCVSSSISYVLTLERLALPYCLTNNIDCESQSPFNTCRTELSSYRTHCCGSTEDQYRYPETNEATSIQQHEAIYFGLNFSLNCRQASVASLSPQCNQCSSRDYYRRHRQNWFFYENSAQTGCYGNRWHE